MQEQIYGHSGKSALVNQGGYLSSLTISRALTIGTLTKDFTLADTDITVFQRPQSFFIIPLTEGTVKVHLVGAPFEETYTFSTTEIKAYLGCPMPFLVDITYMAGTTATLNIGW